MKPEPPQRDADHLARLLEDLEQQAAGLHADERSAEVSSLATAHYAEVDLASRLHGHVGGEVTVHVLGNAQVRGALIAMGDDYLEIKGPGQRWWVLLTALVSVQGVGQAALPAPARGMRSRLGIRSVLRGLAEEGREVGLLARDGEIRQLTIRRVGADFVECSPAADIGRASAADDRVLVPLSAAAAVIR